MVNEQNPETYPSSFDAYLRYAIATDFSYFTGFSRRFSRRSVITLLVHLKEGVEPDAFIKALSAARVTFDVGPMAFRDGRESMKSRFLTIKGGPAIVKQEGALKVWQSLTQYVELSMPTRPNIELTIDSGIAVRPQTTAKTVVAIIDDGCAFAHERFRVSATDIKSRVFAIWDQDPAAPRSKVGARSFGAPVTDFNSGVEYRRTPPDSTTEIGIDEWIALFKTPTGGVNEEACYRRAGFDSLQYQVSHGVHVMDILVGSVPPSSRLSYDPEVPPSFAVSTDDAGKGDTDVIFVQIPKACVDDASGRWLSAQVKEAMTYILSCLSTKTERLVVNLSYGPTTEPHDGLGNLEIALSEFTAFYDGDMHKPKLNIALPAGNSRLTDGHFVFKSSRPGETKRWIWRALPDNPVPIFMEVWVPWAYASAVSGYLRSPGEIPIPVGHQQPYIKLTLGSPTSCCWMITLPPTQSSPADPPPGPHGDWTLELTLAVAGVEVHAYVARSDPNMGSRVLAKQSHFIDYEWEDSQGGFSLQTLKDGVCDTIGSCVVREGTLSGIATATDDQILVAGGLRLSDDVSSRYSSLGPSRGADRQGPDFVLPTDEAPELLGIRAAGTVSGATFRLVGTSTASPQGARRILGPVAPDPCLPKDQAPDCGCEKLPAP